MLAAIGEFLLFMVVLQLCLLTLSVIKDGIVDVYENFSTYLFWFCGIIFGFVLVAGLLQLIVIFVEYMRG